MLLELLKQSSNKTLTENGAVTYETSNSNCVDLFAMIGALRNQSETRIIDLFEKAYIENKDIATKILFYTRDIRGGIGERKVFRTIVKWLANNYPETILKNIEYFTEFGRYDDLLSLFDTKCENEMLLYISKQLAKDVVTLLDENDHSTSLLGKWLPSINASNSNTISCAKKIARALKMNDKEYRQILTKLRKKIDIIENYLRIKDYSFDYSKQPSKAMLKYKNAFIRNDKERYEKFLELVKEGKKTLHTGTLYPYDIIDPIIKKAYNSWYSYYEGNNNNISNEEIDVWDTTWNQLEDFTDGKNNLVVVDGSGSMYGSGTPTPISVAISLAIYFAERNKGTFKNHFITFSTNPKLVEIKGDNIYKKVRYCMKYNEVANTNIQKVFELILNTAVNNNVPQEELPETVYIISDMEWDADEQIYDKSSHEIIKQKFLNYQYILPKIVYWNVQSRRNNIPVIKNENNVVLISGFSPRFFSTIINDNINPYKFMMNILNNKRYQNIIA